MNTGHTTSRIKIFLLLLGYLTLHEARLEPTVEKTVCGFWHCNKLWSCVCQFALIVLRCVRLAGPCTLKQAHTHAVPLQPYHLSWIIHWNFIIIAVCCLTYLNNIIFFSFAKKNSSKWMIATHTHTGTYRRIETPWNFGMLCTTLRNSLASNWAYPLNNR